VRLPVTPEEPDVDDAAAPWLSAEAFKFAFRHHAAGVAVITAEVADGPVAMTASSVTSVSADPPTLLFSVSGHTANARTLERAGTVVVHLLGADQLDLAIRCATPGMERFGDDVAWERLPSGEPAFPGARVRLLGEVVDRMVHGDSTVLAVRVRTSEVAPDAATRAPLAYHDRTWHRLDDGSRIG